MKLLEKKYSLSCWLLVALLVLSPLLSAARTLPITTGARVTYISGQANVKKGQLVKPGQRVTTGSNGRVELTFFDGSRLRIGPATHLQLISDNPSTKQTLVQLDKGRAWNQVRPAPHKKLVIKTRHSIAAVLGTTFALEVTSGHTHTAVIKGSVGVHRPFAESPSSPADYFDKTPSSFPASPDSQPLGPPKEIAPPVYEIPSPVKVVPGPVEVSLEQWLQIVENQEIIMGADGKAEVKTFDPVQKKSDPWFLWNIQMDAQSGRTKE